MAKPEATPEELSSPKKEKTSSWVKENTRNQMAVISTEEKIMNIFSLESKESVEFKNKMVKYFKFYTWIQ